VTSTDTNIEVYCDDSHERSVVAVLTRGDDGFWHGVHHPGRGTGSALQFLADDVPLTGRNIDPSTAPDDDPVGDRLRARYRLRCRYEVMPGRLCGRAMVLREQTAVPVLEALVAKNIHSISLRGLAAIL
jgi:hypothetical protein